jgi:acetylornithine deacetylase/succinyl-diaminopimelate desuccinylase-like protein
MLERVIRRIDHDLDDAIGRWCELLRIPSVSTDAAYADEARRAAHWLLATLEHLGFDVEIHETDGHPVVLGRHAGPGGDAPHLLYYGHYDVQPPDPVDLWHSPPFEPTLEDGPHGRRMVARGAVDDKGQLMMWLEALRAWQAEHGTLPVQTTVLIEGEEEIGSKHLRPFLEQHRDELASADVCVVSDTTMWDIDTPAVTYSLRGLLYTEIACYGPSRDLHSGFYGGAVANPLNTLTHVLGQLHDEHGRVRIPGFYDDVREPGGAEKRDWDGLDMDEGAFLEEAGVTFGAGEAERSLLERLWSRPTGDINGLVGGYTGEGAKTVIPTHGTAKVSFRLVPDQDPEAVAEAFQRFLNDHTYAGCRCEVSVHSAAPAIRFDPESAWLDAARGAMGRVYAREAVLIGCGGSIPIAAWAREILGIETLLMGFSLDDDGMHSPNEKFEVTCFERGIKSHAALLERLVGGH